MHMPSNLTKWIVAALAAALAIAVPASNATAAAAAAALMSVPAFANAANQNAMASPAAPKPMPGWTGPAARASKRIAAAAALGPATASRAMAMPAPAPVSAGMSGAHRFGGLHLALAETLPDGAILSLDKELLIKIGIQLFNVALITAVLIILLYNPVKKFLAERSQRIRQDIDDARDIRKEAAELKARYEKLISGIEREREEILRQTHKIAQDKSDQLLFDTRREVEILHGRAKAELELERKNVSDEMKRQIIEISHLMAGRLVQASMDREIQDQLIEQALKELDPGMPGEL
jgi:F-type H+-transporting ATPase subunit b